MGRIKFRDDGGKLHSIPAESIGPIKQVTGGTQIPGMDIATKLTVDELHALLQTEIDKERARGAVQEKRTITSDYTATGEDYAIYCDASGGALTLTFPTDAEFNGRIWVAKKIDSSVNAVTLSPNIDGAAKSLAAQWQTLAVQLDGSTLYILYAGAAA